MSAEAIEAIAAKPTTTVLLPRLPVFLPTFRPATRAGDWIDTPAGRVKVRGRLGQRHETLLEAICRYYTKRHIIDGEPAPEVDVLVDPADLRRALAGRSGGWYSHAQMLSLMRDLRDTEIEIDTVRRGAHIVVHGSLIAHFVEYRPVAMRNPLGGERHPLQVRLGVGYTILVGVDIHRFWDPTVFRTLRTGAAQALARWCWSQDRGHTPRGGWKLDTIITATSPVALTPIAMRHRRREIRADRDALAVLGIVVTKDSRIEYDGRLAVQQAPGDA